MRSPRSLQNRLLLGFLVSMTAILAGGGFVIYTVIAKHLASENDELLRDRMQFWEKTVRLRPQHGWVVLGPHTSFPDWERVDGQGSTDLVQMRIAGIEKVIPMRSPAL